MLIFINGLMGSGKTTISKKLAQLMDYSFLDIDQWIEEKEAMSISQIFEEKGEEAFRKMESSYLKQLNTEKNIVVSTGGGLPCYFDHMEWMNKHGITVYLKAEAAFLASRLKFNKAQRPLLSKLSDEELSPYLNQLLESRSPFYLQSKLIIDAKNLKAQKLLLSLNSLNDSF